MTTPPKRYNEASLLQAMETAGKFVDDETLREAMKENGIGRPSSRAGIIETLLKRQYIRREKKNLVSTGTGRDLVRIIKARMLKSPELTGMWEKKLRDIERGTFTLEYFMDELQAQLVSIINEVQGDISGQRVSTSAASTSSSQRTSSYKGGSSGGYRSSGSSSGSGSGSRKSSSGGKSTKKGKGPVLVYSDKKVSEGDKCPICGKGTVKKSQYGYFCTEYKTSGCRLTYKGG